MMKKFIGGLTLMTALSAPVAMTSCSEDDVNTVLQLLELFTSTDDLAGTAWMTADSTFGLEFGNNKDGVYYDTDNTEGVAFNYTLNTQTNVLTLQFSNTTMTFTITAFTKNQSMSLMNNSTNRTYVLKYFTGN